MQRKCKKCQDRYENGNQKIIIYLNHQDIESIEDELFTNNMENKVMTKADWKRVNKFWKQLCEQEELWRK
jgi:hypothetical protein